MKKRLTAFTLIELLIVVAIIAILAAIAVPNFLEAQTRSKVSRVYADFRSIATAIESYAVDTNKYPYCLGPDTSSTNPNNWFFPDPPTDYAQGFATRLRMLTSPVAFITKIPDEDPFRPAGSRPTGVAYNNSFEYYDVVGASIRGGGDWAILNTAFMLCGGMQAFDPDEPPRLDALPKWILFCVGPDGREPWQFSGDWLNEFVFYDPTNGTVSKGDIYRSSGKSSFE
jgi:prepilin-type N-terminal cleavage/methylation domain-containing protein